MPQQMRFAEVFLRLGSALVAWMVLYAHILWLAAVYVIGCGPDGDEMYRLLLGFAPFTCGFAFVLPVTRPFAEIHSMLRWLGVPLLLLLPFAVRSIWQVFRTVNIGSSGICDDAGPSAWETLWSPVQLVTLVVVTVLVARMWYSVRQDSRAA